MPARDFQEAMKCLDETFSNRNDAVLQRDRQQACTILENDLDLPAPLSPALKAVATLAAVLAPAFQDYVYDSLHRISQGTPLEVWNALPTYAQQYLTECWPEEGGLIFVGKIEIAALNEGFFFK